ncbi:MAG TPA: hypothetical protein VII12_06450 [Thermoanaerobaculia bacterium]
MNTTGKHHWIQRLIAPLAVWAIGRALTTPKAQSALKELDSRTYVQKRKAIRSFKRAGRNAASRPAWLAAGAAAIAVGIGLMAKATRGK